MNWFSKWVGRKSESERSEADSAPPSAADDPGERLSGPAAPVDQAQLNDRMSALASQVVGDPRWPEMAHDLSLQVLGMLLFGYASALAGPGADPMAAVAAAMTGPVGSPPGWTGEMLDDARQSAHNEDHNPANCSLIEVGETYPELDDADVFANIFANLQSYHDQTEVAVYIIPLFVNLATAERGKGSPLTEAEVLAIRDEAYSLRMTRAQARTFYATLDAQAPVIRLDPERVWEEWQEIRDQIEW
ncbi:MAG TPA: hypothetical protein VF006_13850 [Longimicrobium sp.]